MGTKKADFFDSRDKYLSFVNSTNEKSSIAFKLSSYLKKTRINSDAFRIFDAGTGEGTIISTLLSAAHEQFPEDPIYVCLLYTSPSPRDVEESRMPSSA